MRRLCPVRREARPSDVRHHLPPKGVEHDPTGGGDPHDRRRQHHNQPESGVLDATTGALELFGIYLGDRLGLYHALRRHGASTAAELADTSGIAPRYAREWLEQQAVAGVLTVDDVTANAEVRRYTLLEAHVGVGADPVALDHVAPLASGCAGSRSRSR